NLKGRFSLLLVSGAGPLANLLLAVAGILILKHAPPFQALPADKLGMLVLMNMELLNAIPLAVPLLVLVLINTVLMIFNLLPIPPLDGFGILSDLLPEKWRSYYYQLLPYGVILLVLFMVVPFARHAFNFAIVTSIQALVAIVP
ncbi:MAG TPA: site-2 protease family protein, partial [Chroococcales cyanobacterium]